MIAGEFAWEAWDMKRFILEGVVLVVLIAGCKKKGNEVASGSGSAATGSGSAATGSGSAATGSGSAAAAGSGPSAREGCRRRGQLRRGRHTVAARVR